MKKKQWLIEISQNNWEYTGTAIITAVNVERVVDNNKAVIADGVYIEFDEDINEPEMLD